MMDENSFKIVGNLLVDIGYGLFLLALYTMFETFVDGYNPLGFVHSSEPEVEEEKQEETFKTNHVLWDLITAGTSFVCFIVIICFIYKGGL